MGSGYGSLNRQINNRVGGRKKSAPYQTLTPVQDGEEEVVSLASPFDQQEDGLQAIGSEAAVPVPTPVPAPVAGVGSAFTIGGPVNLNADGIDLNARVATNSYGGALKYSQLSAGDQAIIDARRATGQGASIKAYDPLGDMAAVRYGSGTQYDTADEAINGLSSFLGGLADNSVAIDAKYNLGQYDPSQFAMAGVSPKGGVSGRASTDAAIEYLTKNDVPMSIEVDGQTRYLTTGLGSDVLYGTLGEEALNATNGNDGGSFKDYGEVGTYSTIHVAPESPLDSKFLSAVGMFFPPVALATVAMKGIAGETLHAGDWLKVATAGLETYGAMTKPVDAAAAADAGTAAMQAADAAGLSSEAAMAAGQAAQDAALAGSGLTLAGKTLDYTQSTALLNVAATGDPIVAATQLFGADLINGGLSKIGITEEALSGVGIQYDDFQEGLTKAVETAAGGGDIKDALLAGLGKYITEGGTLGLGGLLTGSLPDIDLGVLEDMAKDIVRPLGDIGTAVARFVEDSIPNVDPILDVLRPVGDVIEDTAQAVGDAGSAIDDAVIQPVGNALSVLDTAVRDALSTVDDAVIQPTGDLLEDIGQGVGDVVETVVDAIPSVDLPDISLPNVGLPSVGLPQVVMPSSPSATRTTDTLFGDMLKFETEITPFQQALIQLQQQQQMTSLPATQQLVNYNRLGQFLQPTQPAEGLITGRRFNT